MLATLGVEKGSSKVTASLVDGLVNYYLHWDSRLQKSITQLLPKAAENNLFEKQVNLASAQKQQIHQNFYSLLEEELPISIDHILNGSSKVEVWLKEWQQKNDMKSICTLLFQLTHYLYFNNLKSDFEVTNFYNFLDLLPENWHWILIASINVSPNDWNVRLWSSLKRSLRRICQFSDDKDNEMIGAEIDLLGILNVLIPISEMVELPQELKDLVPEAKEMDSFEMYFLIPLLVLLFGAAATMALLH